MTAASRPAWLNGYWLMSNNELVLTEQGGNQIMTDAELQELIDAGAAIQQQLHKMDEDDVDANLFEVIELAMETERLASLINAELTRRASES